MDIRIYYEDTDCGGVVYYANYLRYFERARTEFFRQGDIDIAELTRKGILFVVSKAGIKYLQAAGYGDTINVETRLTELKGVTFNINYTVRLKSDGRILVTGNTLMACVDGKRRPQKITGDLRSQLSSMVKQSDPSVELTSR